MGDGEERVRPVLMLIPAVGFTLVFSYLPNAMNVIAFMDYKLTSGWLGLGSKWVGFAQFARFLSDPVFYEVTLRTIYYAAAKLVVSFPAPIILALLLNELRNQAFKRTVQTISYLPFFVSWSRCRSHLHVPQHQQHRHYQHPDSSPGREEDHLHVPAQLLPAGDALQHAVERVGLGRSSTWRPSRRSNSKLYEAARIDGAGRWKQLLHITLPGIMPAVIIILILNAGSIFSADFDQIVNLQNNVIQTDTDVINVYSYHVGVRSAATRSARPSAFSRPSSISAWCGSPTSFPSGSGEPVCSREDASWVFLSGATGSGASPGELVFDGVQHVCDAPLRGITLYPFWYVLVYALNNSQDAYAGGIGSGRGSSPSTTSSMSWRAALRSAYVVTVARTVLVRSCTWS